MVQRRIQIVQCALNIQGPRGPPGEKGFPGNPGVGKIGPKGESVSSRIKRHVIDIS